MFRLALTLLLLSSQLPSATAQEKVNKLEQATDQSKIVWLIEDKKENLNLLAKVSPNTSVASYIESRIISKLTQYDIQLKRVSVKRIDHILKTELNACSANRAKLASREKYSLFSISQAFYLTHKLFRYDEDTALPKSLFNQENEINSLADVFTNRRKR